jgi:DNA-binding transcriptional LysR family regulator
LISVCKAKFQVKDMANFKEQKYILEIAKYQGISEAAERLYISQPALSRYLSNVEQELGVQLFDRVGKKLIPNFAGEQYIEYANHLLNLQDEFLAKISDIKAAKSGSLAVGSTLGRGRTVFSKIIPEFYQIYPNFNLKIYQEVVVKLEEYLRKDIVQLVIETIEEDDKDRDGVVVETISTEEIVLIVSKDRKVKSYQKFGFRHPWVDIHEFKQDIFLLLNKGTRLRSSEDRILKEADISPKTMEFTSIDTIWTLISQNFGVAMATDFMHSGSEAEDQYKNVNVYSVGSVPIRWKFVMMTRIGTVISEPINTIMDITRRTFGDGKNVP